MCVPGNREGQRVVLPVFREHAGGDAALGFHSVPQASAGQRREKRHVEQVQAIALARFRDLILNLVIRDLKVRYKDSILGFFWSFCRPLFLMIILGACTQKEEMKVEAFETSASGKKMEAVQVKTEVENALKIHLKPEEAFQTITGFGGSFTEASAYLLNELSQENRKKNAQSMLAMIPTANAR